MFKNMIVYRIAESWQGDLQVLEDALQKTVFAECGATQERSVGWMPPRGEQHGPLAESVAGQWVMRFMSESKMLPASVLNRRVNEKAAHIEATEGRKPGKKELRDLKDDALIALLPQAFPRRGQVTVWIEPTRRWLVMDAGSQGKADEVITSLVRVAGKGFGVGLLQTATSPQAAMTAWLADPEQDEEISALPHAFNIERECELKGSGDEPAVVKFTRHPLQTDEVRQHIAEGKLPTRLALGWAGRVGFTLTQALQLKKIAFQEGVFEEGAASKDDDRFDADVALSTGELSGLITDLIDALGGEVDSTAVTDQAPAATPQVAEHVAATAGADDDGPPF